MAWHSSLNQTPATSAVGVWNLIAQLIAAGWTKQKDSDGTTYSATGAQVTGGGSGTHGLGNAYAWVCMKSPGGQSMTIQRSNTDNKTWRICYSPVVGFTGGAPAAHVCPSTTDQYIVLGSGTEASPTFALWFQGTEGSMRFNSRALDVAPYTWWMASWPVGGGSPCGGGFFDGVVNPVTGLAVVADNDPHVISIDASGSTFSQGTLGAAGYSAANGPGNNVMAAVTAVSFPFAAPTQGIATDPDTGKDVLRPLEFYMGGGGYFKGVTQQILWEMCGTSTSQRPLAFTPGLAATGDHIIVGTAALPWDSSTPLV